MLMAIGIGAQVLGSLSGSRAKKKANRKNKKLAKQQAQFIRDQTAAEISAQQRVARKVQGGIRAAYAASGVTMEGSPLDVLEESARAAELDKLNIKYRGDVQVWSALNGIEAPESGASGVLSAAGTLLSGIAGGK